MAPVGGAAAGNKLELGAGMAKFSRREFTKLFGAAGLATAVGGREAMAQLATPNVNRGARPRVVIIGGGPGGGTLAHILRRGSPLIDVTLIEAKHRYTTCFFSNLYLGGLRPLESLIHDYHGLRAIGVNVINEFAVSIDASRKTVALKNNVSVAYDKLVLSPGIEFKYDSIDGYSEEASNSLPHAYRAGPQTKLLYDQLRAMPDGGVVVLAPPANPYRCPPGPYERACLIAHYLKTNKPRSKLVVVEPKRRFAKQGLFMNAFKQLYGDNLEFHLTDEIDNFALKSVDVRSKTIETESGLKVQGDVINIIPPQKAGRMAEIAGCTDGDWCPIDAETFSSRLVPDVYVIGDSSAAGDMPKSAFSANSQAKSVSNHLEAVLAGKPKYPPRYRNTCWSMVGPNNSIKVGAYYRPVNDKVTVQLGFVSEVEEDGRTREKSYKESLGWYAGIVAEVFNKRVAKI